MDDQPLNQSNPSVNVGSDDILQISPLVSDTTAPQVISEPKNLPIESFSIDTNVVSEETPVADITVVPEAPVVQEAPDVQEVPAVAEVVVEPVLVSEETVVQEAPTSIEPSPVVESPVAEVAVAETPKMEDQVLEASSSQVPVSEVAVVSAPVSSFGFGKLLKGAFLFVLAGSMFAGNFFLDNYLASANKEVSNQIEAFKYNQVNNIPDGGVMRFSTGENGAAPLMDTVFSNDKHEYVFKLSSGTVWGNFSTSDAKVNILADRVVIIPNRASFDLSFDGKNVYLYVYRGDAYVGFLPDAIKISEYQDEYSNIFMNRMLVPKGTKITIPLYKIDDKLKLLLYSRLVGEFRYSLIPDEIRETSWVVENLKRDRKYLETLKQDFTSNVQGEGRASMDGSTNKFIYWVEENLSFVADKKQEVVLNHLFAYLDDAIFYSVNEDNSNMQASLDEFNKYYLSRQDLVNVGGLYDKILDKYIKKLLVFDSTDSEYQVLKFLLDMRFSENKDVYGIVNRFWVNVYDVIDSTDTAIDQALDFYYSYLKRTLGKKTDVGYYRMYIAYQNQLFDNLFMNYPVFYKDSYFAMKSVLEKEMISLYEDGQLKNELTQDLINEKIELLKRLMKFFFDEKVSVEDSKLIMSRLIEEINGLMDPTKAQDAVVKLFESQLKTIVDFWGYLKSPEYYSSKVYGLNHKDRFQTYLKEREKILSFINIQEDILGVNSQKQLTASDVALEIQQIITKNKEIKEFQMDQIVDINQRYVNIKGLVSEFPFEAVYDRSSQVIKDVKVNGEIISTDPIKIDSLSKLVNDKYGVVDPDKPTQQDPNQLAVETNAQRIARIYISKKIAEVGYTITEKNVQLVDEINSIYRITDVFVKGYEKVLVTFDYDFKLEKATNVFFTFDGKPIVVEGSYGIKDIYDMIIKGVDKELTPPAVDGQSKPISRTKLPLKK